MRKRIKIICVVGARPNFVKIAPLFKEFKKYKTIKPILVHTGQHYNLEMSQVFFQELKIPKPDYNLNVGSGSHAWQTAKVMEKLEPVILKEKPNLVAVVGDVNSTLAGALTAVKLSVPIAHIEAGLRSFDMTMPEEINRILTDHISDFLFVTEEEAYKNLIKEGINKKKIFFVGDIMVDSLLIAKKKIKKSNILNKLGLKEKKYAFLTLHRPSNVDNKKILTSLLETFNIIQQKTPIVFAMHPRTEDKIKKFNLTNKLKSCKNIILTAPFSYLDTIFLMINSKFVLTDSGGIQQETTSLSIPCLTIRENTERPVTITQGTNVLCGVNKNKIIKEANKILSGKQKRSKIPKYWDGKTAKRIVRILKNNF